MGAWLESHRGASRAAPIVLAVLLLTAGYARPTGGGSFPGPLQRHAWDLSPLDAPIDHVVVLLQENHAYDNFFGDYCRTLVPYCSDTGNGIDPGQCIPEYPGNTSGPCVPLRSIPSSVQPNLPHNWSASHQAWNQGAMNDFYLAEGRQDSTFTYADHSLLPVYWDLAEQYALADNFFSSTLSNSLPNHWYLLAGTAPPETENANLSHPFGTRLTGSQSTYLNESNATPTIADLLVNSALSWRYYDFALPRYNASLATGRAFDPWAPLAAKGESYETPFMDHFAPDSLLFSDAARGSLPNVSWVIPPFPDSDHPPADYRNGQAWVKAVLEAVESSSDWARTAVFITWDDYGGFYDHVSPPAMDANGLSFRVPLLVVSPYARANTIVHVQGSFESLLRFIEWRWGLPSLTARDARASLPLAYFDFNQTPLAPLSPDTWAGMNRYPIPFPSTASATFLSPGEVTVLVFAMAGVAGIAVGAAVIYVPPRAPPRQGPREGMQGAPPAKGGRVPDKEDAPAPGCASPRRADEIVALRGRGGSVLWRPLWGVDRTRESLPQVCPPPNAFPE